ncbi:tripartite tricarboxylate transporter TctB family protein [Salinicola corii]|uniref:Tripartite tricarboxylate transporter TctB family protein n=1 Tax=Salinicola corii TaxID=2606937 RepID=A0A640WD70_9GAMM|nr:tripartite tricarboxylate transporter TctB family protein [Salinicola corii]KAA0017470.1 tripartite tricarboxylate transporter TctB family protein [Salinicola corii]
MSTIRDRILATVVLGMVAILAVESGNIPDKTSWQMFDSAIFPRLLLGVIGILATLLWIQSLLASRRATPLQETREDSALTEAQTIEPTPEEYTARPRFHYQVPSLFVLFGLYTWSLPLLGYLIATLAFLIIAQALLLGVDTPRKWLINLVTAGILAPLIFVIFEYGLNVWLP